MENLTLIIWLLLFVPLTTLNTFLTERVYKIRGKDIPNGATSTVALIEACTFVVVTLYLMKQCHG